MILDFFLGYWVTDAPDVLASFLATALQRYNALEEALAPISTAVTDLERDWHPRSAAFWQQVLAALATARQAGQACMVLFAREHSSFERPVPLGVPVASIRATVSLHRIATEIEEAGILLTVYSATCDVRDETHIRQRQRLVRALREVETVARLAIMEGPAGEDTWLQKRQERGTTARRPALRIVCQQEGRADQRPHAHPGRELSQPEGGPSHVIACDCQITVTTRAPGAVRDNPFRVTPAIAENHRTCTCIFAGPGAKIAVIHVTGAISQEQARAAVAAMWQQCRYEVQDGDPTGGRAEPFYLHLTGKPERAEVEQ